MSTCGQLCAGVPDDPCRTPVCTEPALEGVIVERDFTRLAQGMVESLTEFDFDPGSDHSIPAELRERLLTWCADLDTWDRSIRPRL